MSTTVSNTNSTSTNYSTKTYEEAQYTNGANSAPSTPKDNDSIEHETEKKPKFKAAPAKAKDNDFVTKGDNTTKTKNNSSNSSGTKENTSSTSNQKTSEVGSESPSSEKISTESFSSPSTEKTANENSSSGNEAQKASNPPPPNPQNDISKENVEKSNEAVKEDKTKLNNILTNYENNGNVIGSDPFFIPSRFRSGDPELFKLLSDPALGPILMAKIQDAAAAETRMHTLLSNLQKAKDDTLKAIVNNIR